MIPGNATHSTETMAVIEDGVDNVDLIQECANSSIDRITGCTANFQDWQEVCSCRVDFCNTFAFLREYNIRSDQGVGRYLDKRTKFKSKFYKSDKVRAEAFDYSNNDKFEKIFNQKFTNGGPLLTNFDVYDDGNDRKHSDTYNDGLDNYSERKEKLNRKNRRQMNDVPRHYKINLNRTQQLTVLLIILPLVLGTATVLIIFINYHCKMCS
uniref:Uncharacterized protein n=1 Tax=Romanomermis culicivorax TaxID=13658 RepID=A0A915JNJ2_ROMCU